MQPFPRKLEVRAAGAAGGVGRALLAGDEAWWKHAHGAAEGSSQAEGASSQPSPSGSPPDAAAGDPRAEAGDASPPVAAMVSVC